MYAAGMPDSTSRALPLTRGDCLTAARRYHLALVAHTRRPGAPPEPPTPGGYQTVERADGALVRVPTDGRPDGANAVRPCPYFTCKYHVALEFNQFTGSVAVMWTPPERGGRGMHTDNVTEEAGDFLVEELDRVRAALRAWEGTPEGRVHGATPPQRLQTCALDLADIAAEEGALTLAQVGDAQHKTRERIRQVSEAAFEALKREGVLAEHADEALPPPVVEELAPLEYPDGRRYEVFRRSGSNVTVACSHPDCDRRFSARTARLLAMPAPLCPEHAP